MSAEYEVFEGNFTPDIEEFEGVDVLDEFLRGLSYQGYELVFMGAWLSAEEMWDLDRCWFTAEKSDSSFKVTLTQS